MKTNETAIRIYIMAVIDEYGFNSDGELNALLNFADMGTKEEIDNVIKELGYFIYPENENKNADTAYYLLKEEV